jgi:hypothetical protein
MSPLLERYFIPLAPYVFTALAILLCLFHTITTGTEIRCWKSWSRSRHAAEASALRELETRIADLSERLREVEDRTGMLGPPVPPKSGLNMSRRTQVLRLARRGEHPDNIAALLGLPRREVELLLRVRALAAGAGNN